MRCARCAQKITAGLPCDYHEREAWLRRQLIERVLMLPGGCWLWMGHRMAKGYGRVRVPWLGRQVVAHRAIYEQMRGPVCECLVLDHLCRVRACVNPDHLEPVSSRENTVRGVNPAASNAAKTHCLRGHPLTGPNLIVRYDGCRECRTCAQSRWAAYNAKRAAS